MKRLAILFISTIFFQNLQAQVTDIDGKTYKTIKISNHLWMAENLNVSRYRNGDSVPQIQGDRQWENLSTGAWCYYENKKENGILYGKLYNYMAASDSRGLAPIGWHIPSEAEWKELVDSLGGDEKAGLSMKSKEGWQTLESEFNSSGFSGKQGGSRENDGKFIGATAEWWSADESNSYNAFFIFLNNSISNVGISNYDKLSGFSVRCIKDY